MAANEIKLALVATNCQQQQPLPAQPPLKEQPALSTACVAAAIDGRKGHLAMHWRVGSLPLPIRTLPKHTLLFELPHADLLKLNQCSLVAFPPLVEL